jgi:hypothetical protein
MLIDRIRTKWQDYAKEQVRVEQYPDSIKAYGSREACERLQAVFDNRGRLSEKPRNAGVWTFTLPCK